MGWVRRGGFAHFSRSVTGCSLRPKGAGRPLLAEQLLNQFVSRQVEVISYVAEDFGKCANAELFMSWDRDVMLDSLELGRYADVAAGLAGDFITETTQGPNELIAAHIAGKFQAGMTSSLTM